MLLRTRCTKIRSRPVVAGLRPSRLYCYGLREDAAPRRVIVFLIIFRSVFVGRQWPSCASSNFVETFTKTRFPALRLVYDPRVSFRTRHHCRAVRLLSFWNRETCASGVHTATPNGAGKRMEAYYFWYPGIVFTRSKVGADFKFSNRP